MNDKFPPSSPYHRPEGHPWDVTVDEVLHKGTRYEHAIEYLFCPVCKINVNGPFFEQSSGARPIYYLGTSEETSVEVGHGDIPKCKEG